MLIKSNCNINKRSVLFITLIIVICVICIILAFLIRANNITIGSYVVMGSYEQDNDILNGKEPIEWLVLAKENNKVLLISRYALDSIPYSEHLKDVPWDNCSLRTWLNDTFINEAFSSDEQKCIISSTVTADKNPLHDTEQGSDTTDKVFLLSMKEADEYFDSDSARQCKATEYCHAQGTCVSRENGNCWWWLRTMGDIDIDATVVDDEGPLQDCGDRVSIKVTAVRPAMWCDIAGLKKTTALTKE